ncbi:hypothetical protein I79_005089 [Cricetulus griseus]|uniref:Uncharacterized protein n=1 Tax=Cricetulus griseus TaxID=10029 RepID=G3H489_CRIGR|nr:hypothetical protein I79_005089 [Cricetulus griseus]
MVQSTLCGLDCWGEMWSFTDPKARLKCGGTGPFYTPFSWGPHFLQGSPSG